MLCTKRESSRSSCPAVWRETGTSVYSYVTCCISNGGTGMIKQLFDHFLGRPREIISRWAAKREKVSLPSSNWWAWKLWFPSQLDSPAWNIEILRVVNKAHSDPLYIYFSRGVYTRDIDRRCLYTIICVGFFLLLSICYASRRRHCVPSATLLAQTITEAPSI